MKTVITKTKVQEIREKVLEKISLRLAVSLLLLTLSLGAFGFLGLRLYRHNVSPTPFVCPVTSVPERWAERSEAGIQNDAGRLDAVSGQLRQDLAAYQNEKSKQSLATLRMRAAQRKQLLVRLLHNDPDGVQPALLSPADWSALDEVADGCGERVVSAKGTYAVLHGDDFRGGRSLNLRRLEANDGVWVVHPLTAIREPAPGQSVELRNVLAIDRELLVTTETELVPLGTVQGEETTAQVRQIEDDPPPGTPPEPIPADTALVVKVNFTNDRSTTTAPETPEQAAVAAAKYGNQNALGKISHRILTYGWYELSLGRSCGGETLYNDPVTRAAITAVDPFIDFRTIQHLQVIAPFATSGGGAPCIWQGLSDGQRHTVQTGEGAVTLGISWVRSDSVRPIVMAHEIGHDWVNHAAFKPCAVGGSCANDETPPVSDPYDVMGGQAMGHFNALHKDRAGWFGPSELVSVSGAAGTVLTYDLEPIETVSSRPRALKIPRGNGKFLSVEYRRPVNGDEAIDPNAFPGVLLHIDRDSQFGGFYDSVLIDPTVDASNPASPMSSALLPGQEFTDPLTNTTVTTLSVTSTMARVRVTLGATL